MLNHCYWVWDVYLDINIVSYFHPLAELVGRGSETQRQVTYTKVS